MSNQTIAAFAALGNAVDWENEGLDLQAIIEAGNQRKLGKPLTEWLASRGWEASTVKSSVLVAPKDLDWWLDKTQEFAAKHLGVVVDLRKTFIIPTELLWVRAIPVFDPGTLNNGDAFKLLKMIGLNPWGEIDVVKYSGSEKSGKQTLHFIENSKKPNADTMGKSPNDLRATGKQYLRLRGYALAMAVYHFATGEVLDPGTFTLFPEDRIHDFAVGDVARCGWSSDQHEIRFYSGTADDCRPRSGGRVAMPVSLKS